MVDAFLTLDEVARILGGAERPFSRDMIERLLQQGRLQDNGATRKLRRVLRSSVDALIRDIEQGGSLWLSAERTAMVRNHRRAQRSGDPAKPSSDGPLVARKLRPLVRNIETPSPTDTEETRSGPPVARKPKPRRKPQ